MYTGVLSENVSSKVTGMGRDQEVGLNDLINNLEFPIYESLDDQC